MGSLLGRVRRGIGFLLTHSAAIPALVGGYVVAGVILVLTDYNLNEEGLLTHYWASWLRQDFLPVFFLQKTHPALCALYALVSAGGVRATLMAHVLVAATAIPMMAATARVLGHRLPNLPALIVALSPLYFYGGPAGFSNVDGIVGTVLALYLLCVRRWSFTAGLVAGVLPWIRFELGAFSAVMAFYALATRGQRSLLFGMAVFPMAYAAGGAWYHHDALWMIHFPPTAPFEPGNPIYGNQLIGLRYLLEPAAAVTPVAGLVAALWLGRLRSVERALLAYTLLSVIAIDVLPIFRIGNFGAAPRYMLHVLPALALLVGRALEPWWQGERPGVGSLLATAGLSVWIATRQHDQSVVLLLIAIYALAMTAAWLRRGMLVAALVVVLVFAGPFLPLRTDVARPRYLDLITGWLTAHRDEWAGPIYTNAQLLAPFVAHRFPDTQVYHMAGVDIANGLVLLTNPENGQRDRIRRLAADDLYGKTLFPPIAPEDLPADALIALRDDVRLPLLLPAAVWSGQLEMLVEAPDYRIARLRRVVAPSPR